MDVRDEKTYYLETSIHYYDYDYDYDLPPRACGCRKLCHTSQETLQHFN